MLNLAVLADIHGNLAALEAVLADATRRGVHGYLVAGDMVSGPQPSQVLELLCEHNACMIKGNNELVMLGYAKNTLPSPWWTYKQFEFARCSYHLMSEVALATIELLPEQRSLSYKNAAPLRLAHGSPLRVDEGLFPDLDPGVLENRLAEINEPVLLCGHTHIPWIFNHDGKLAVNPGAVTGGLNGDPRAWYAELCWMESRWHAELHPVDYDLERIEQAFQKSGLLEQGGAFARACLASFHSGRDTPLNFVRFAYNLARRSGWQGDFVPDEIWKAAELEFEWDDH